MADRHPEFPHRILVTGVGGAPGFDLARTLKRRGCLVITVDSDPLAAGLLLDGTIPRTVPAADSPDYCARMLALCREMLPDAILPTVESELAALIDLSGPLADLAVRTWLPSPAAVAACADKAAFHQVLSRNGIPTPRTFLPHQIDDIPEDMPLIVKPRRGQGSKNVHPCSTRRHAALLCELVTDPLIQERVAGREFTADCLVDRTGCASVILRYRLRVKNGLAVVAVTFHDDEVAAVVRRTAEAVGIAGVCCVQGFVRDQEPQRVLVTEMNARIAGAFPLSEAAGADLVGQTVRGLLGLPVEHDRLTYTPGVRLTKYVETLAIDDARADGTHRVPGL